MKPQNLSSYVTLEFISIFRKKNVSPLFCICQRECLLWSNLFTNMRNQKKIQTGFGWKTSLQILSLCRLLKFDPMACPPKLPSLLYREDRFVKKLSAESSLLWREMSFQVKRKILTRDRLQRNRIAISPCATKDVPLKPIFKWPDKIFFEGRLNGLWINEWMRPLGTGCHTLLTQKFFFCWVSRPICKVWDDKGPWKLGIHRRTSEILRFGDDFLIPGKNRPVNNLFGK